MSKRDETLNVSLGELRSLVNVEHLAVAKGVLRRWRRARLPRVGV